MSAGDRSRGANSVRMTLAQDIERFLASPAIADSTRRAYRADLRDFAEWFGEGGRLDRVDVRALSEYTADLGRARPGGKLAPATIARRLSAVRSLLRFSLGPGHVPEVPLVIDRYEDALHMAEFARPHERTPAQHADWLDLMVRTASEVLEIPRNRVFLKRRDRQRGTAQYERVDGRRVEMAVQEGGLNFLVNLSDYVDTGLFLDHRITRQMIREVAAGKHFLNLFAYTASFTVYAAAGGAATTTSVDKSSTYIDWARKNLDLNHISGPRHQLVHR